MMHLAVLIQHQLQEYTYLPLIIFTDGSIFFIASSEHSTHQYSISFFKLCLKLASPQPISITFEYVSGIKSTKSGLLVYL